MNHLMDHTPPGIRPLIEGVASQSALAFTLELVEVRPFVKEGNSSRVMFIPHTTMATEIVARTSVSVHFSGASESPVVEIRNTSLDDIVENIREVRRGGQAFGREWTEQEVVQEFVDHPDAVVQELFEFCREHSADRRFFAPGKKAQPVFAFYVSVRDKEGGAVAKQLFRYSPDVNGIRFYLNRTMLAEAFGDSVFGAFLSQLKESLGDAIDLTKIEPTVLLDSIRGRTQGLRTAVLWLLDQVDAEA